jgi:serine-type D-Ala-D-Ala carboxypeptidase/endopeptidase
MKPGVFLKAGLGCAVLLVAGFVALFVYVLYRQHSYKTMADSHDLAKRIQKFGADYVAQRTNAALVIGVVQRNKTNLFGFGHVSATNSAAPDGETLFEIGSATKVFTAVTLARMVNDGTVKLEDPVSRFLPPDVKSPEKKGRVIALGHLATHTAGLPRLPDDLLDNAKDKDNPYANYHAADLYQSLSKTKLKNVPGEKSFYSNFGFGLLGHLLATKAGTNYESLVREAVCAPLAMSNTAMTLTEEQQRRLSPGHDPKGVVVKNWDFDAMAGCGAFRSTANDLLKFTAANLYDGTDTISRALAEARKIHFSEFAGGVGLAWQIREPVEGQHWHWHNGGTGGYVSFVGFDKPNQCGVVILSNYGDAMAGDNSVDLMGVEILRLLPKISLE